MIKDKKIVMLTMMGLDDNYFEESRNFMKFYTQKKYRFIDEWFILFHGPEIKIRKFLNNFPSDVNRTFIINEKEYIPKNTSAGIENLVSKIREKYSPDDYIINLDSDEFVNLKEEMFVDDYDTLLGLMVDMIKEKEGKCHMTDIRIKHFDEIKSWVPAQKNFIRKVKVEADRYTPHFIPDSENKYSPILYPIYHYKWNEKALSKYSERSENYKKENVPWYDIPMQLCQRVDEGRYNLLMNGQQLDFRLENGRLKPGGNRILTVNSPSWVTHYNTAKRYKVITYNDQNVRNTLLQHDLYDYLENDLEINNERTIDIKSLKIMKPIKHQEEWRTELVRQKGYGVNLTLIELIKQAKEEGLEYFVSLENDVFLRKRPHECIDQVPEDWDMIICDGEGNEENGKVAFNIYMQCLIIHSRVYDSLIEHLKMYTDTADEAMNESGFFKKHNVYSLKGISGQRDLKTNVSTDYKKWTNHYNHQKIMILASPRSGSHFLVDRILGPDIDPYFKKKM